MICQRCKKNPASVTIEHVINTKKIEVSLCGECAEKKGLESPVDAFPQMFGDYMSEFLEKEAHDERFVGTHSKCNGCGLTWDTFQRTGQLGCEACYDAFRFELDILLRRIHGSIKHIGSRPRSQRSILAPAELQHIQSQLQAAIANEDFEQAAQLRDRIRDAQAGLDNAGNDGILR
jgi:protein arginine kinase activator